MKLRTLALATTLAFSSTAFADSYTGYYLQGELGWGKTEVKEAGHKLKDDGTVSKLSFGYDFGDTRLALDYTVLPKFKNKVEHKEEGVSVDASLKTHSVGLSAIQEINTGTDFTPYVGARISHNMVSNHVKVKDEDGSLESKIKKSKFGYGVLAGVEYSLTPNIIFNVGAEYNYLGKFDKVKVTEFGGRAGVRFVF